MQIWMEVQSSDNADASDFAMTRKSKDQSTFSLNYDMLNTEVLDAHLILFVYNLCL
jgi:hypothetical protein